MKKESQLLRAYLAEIQDPRVAAELFLPDGVVELPWLNLRAQGKEETQKLISHVLSKVPDLRMQNPYSLDRNPGSSVPLALSGVGERGAR